MAQLFTPRADRILRSLLALAVVGGFAVILVLADIIDPDWLGGARAAPPQPAAFSHALHVGGVGIDCRMCHHSVERAARAGMPPMWTCAGCHLALEPRPVLDWTVAWRRVQTLPDHVTFHHGIHVARGVACAACHGAVERMQETRAARSFTMEWCLACHRNPSPFLAELGVRDVSGSEATGNPPLPPGERARVRGAAASVERSVGDPPASQDWDFHPIDTTEPGGTTPSPQPSPRGGEGVEAAADRHLDHCHVCHR